MFYEDGQGRVFDEGGEGHDSMDWEEEAEPII